MEEHMIAQDINALSKKISSFIKEAKKRKKKAKKNRVKHYFEGQQDALEQVLIELKNMKYELDTSGESEDEIEEETEENEHEKLFQKALEKGTIIRKTSFYICEDFPGGKFHGKQKVLDALKNQDLFERIKKKLDEEE
jgi:hypothetical protein